MNEEFNELEIFGDSKMPDPHKGWELYKDGKYFNDNIRLNDTVRTNENFYIGKQWEGVNANGNSTPVLNFIKRTTEFVVATITADDVKSTASPLANTVGTPNLAHTAEILNDEFEAIIERNNVSKLIRRMARNSAVDGDGCIFSYWDPDAPTGQKAKGGIKSEILENTRVFFGNPNTPDVQSQPHIIIPSMKYAVW